MTAPALDRVMPTYPELRRVMADIALTRGEWAGVPMPIEGLSLHIEPSYPYQELGDHVPSDEDRARDKKRSANGLNADGLANGEMLVNSWYSARRFSYVFVVRRADGRGIVFTLPQHRYIRRLEIMLRNYNAAWAHDLEAETTAMLTLSQHITTEQMRQYMVLGQFLEKSKRSGVHYIFRRVAPTIALRPSLDGQHMKCIAVLCMHPIAYYRETTVGAMTPTDDVLAHLLLMRGDEVMLWRRANQHQPDDPEAML